MGTIEGAPPKETILLDWLKVNDYPETEPDNIEELSYGNSEFEAHGNEYLVLTDSEADERTKEYILESLWAFNTDFICGFIGDFTCNESIQEMQAKQCEGCNNIIRRLIGEDNLDDFVGQAISADGRGHFLNHYDGDEHEHSFAGVLYFIYQTN